MTGKYRSEADLGKSPRGAGMKKYLNERGMRILAALDSLAKEYSTSLATIALSWLMSRPVVTSAIASATSLDQLKTLLDATRIDLSPEALRLLDI